MVYVLLRPFGAVYEVLEKSEHFLNFRHKWVENEFSNTGGSQITMHHLLIILANEKWAEKCMQVSFLPWFIKEEDKLSQKNKILKKKFS